MDSTNMRGTVQGYFDRAFDEQRSDAVLFPFAPERGLIDAENIGRLLK